MHKPALNEAQREFFGKMLARMKETNTSGYICGTLHALLDEADEEGNISSPFDQSEVEDICDWIDRWMRTNLEVPEDNAHIKTHIFFAETFEEQIENYGVYVFVPNFYPITNSVNVEATRIRIRMLEALLGEDNVD